MEISFFYLIFLPGSREFWCSHWLFSWNKWASWGQLGWRTWCRFRRSISFARRIWISSCGGFLSFKNLSEEFGSTEEEYISFDLLVFLTDFLRSLSRLTRSSLSMWTLTNHQPLALNKTVQTCQAKTGNNETILRFWQQFLRLSLTSHTDQTLCQGNFQGKATSGVHFIYPKLRDLVVGKEDDKR